MNSEQQGKLEAAQSGSQLSPFPAALSRIGALAQSTRAEGAPLGWHNLPCSGMGPFVGSSPQQLAALVVGWVLCFGELHHPQEAGSAGSAHLQSCPFCAGWGGEFVSDLFCAVTGSDRWSAKRRKAEWSSLQMAGRKWVRFLECC